MWGRGPVLVTSLDPRTDARAGAAVTAAVLVGGIASFSMGNPRLSQVFMRMRIVAQGFTVAAIGFGTYTQYAGGGAKKPAR